MPVKAVRKMVFEGLFPHQNRMRTLTGIIGFYQRSGLQTLTHKTGIMKLFPETLATMDLVLPKSTKNEKNEKPSRIFTCSSDKEKTCCFLYRMLNGYHVLRNK